VGAGGTEIGTILILAVVVALGSDKGKTASKSGDGFGEAEHEFKKRSPLRVRRLTIL
jgi:hypothetical protein